MTKKIIIALVVVLALALGGYFLFQYMDGAYTTAPEDETATSTDPMDEAEEDVSMEEEPSPEESEEEEVAVETEGESVLGTSAEGRDIVAHHYGTGSTELLFVGGFHGGYSWNTSLLSFEMMDYLENNPELIPENIKVTVIPVMNPDGLNRIVGTADRFSRSDVPSNLGETIPGRFNANGVDLNRNFDCNWQSTGIWQDREVDGGTGPFSEPETAGFRNYIEMNNPTAVVVYYSAAGGVYSSSCGESVLPETSAIANAYAERSGYPAHESFDFYETTGDAADWLAKLQIPSISVLLSDHENTERNKNIRGLESLLDYYSE